jgi:hypothetical protein
MAEAHYSSGRRELATFGFPGLYYPGLLTIGPSLHLYGEISGQISLSGRFSASVGYDFPVCNPHPPDVTDTDYRVFSRSAMPLEWPITTLMKYFVLP